MEYEEMFEKLESRGDVQRAASMSAYMKADGKTAALIVFMVK